MVKSPDLFQHLAQTNIMLHRVEYCTEENTHTQKEGSKIRRNTGLMKSIFNKK